MMMPAGERKHFLGRKVDYLFSYDLAFEKGPESQASPAVGGVCLRVTGNGVRSPVYHALGDDTVLGHDAIAGVVDHFDDRVLVRERTHVGVSAARLTILTEDRALIFAQYQGVLRLGHRGLPRLLGERTRFQAKAFITPRFETAYSKYRWLAERQCIGYGTVEIENGALRAATFDIYSAVAPLG